MQEADAQCTIGINCSQSLLERHNPLLIFKQVITVSRKSCCQYFSSGKVKHNNALQPLIMSYRAETAENIVATGHSVQVNFTSGSTIKGAHLEGTYSLAQFHLHWGQAKFVKISI